MKKPSISLALLAISILVFGAACQRSTENGNTNNGGLENENTTVNENRSVNENEVNSNVNSETDTNASDEHANVNENENRDTNTNEDTSNDVSGALRLTSPDKGETIDSPFDVEGKSGAATVRDGEFRTRLTFAFTNTTNGIIEVVESGGATVSTTVTFKVESSDNSNENSNTNSSDNSNDNTNSSDDSGTSQSLY